MKRIIASAGLVALGIVGAKAAVTASAPSDKPWSVSASLRGFYDDNYALEPNGTNKHDSFGFEVNPKVGVNLNGQQTTFGADYSYTLRYYDDRPHEKIDHTHEFNTWLTHQFSERYSVDLRDSLVYSQEPTLTEAGTGVIRTDGTVLHNTGSAAFTAELTRIFGIVLGYRNEYYDYQDQTYSALLDRMEQYANLDLTWNLSPTTVFLTGYQFGTGDYTGSSFSKVKDFYAHYLYVGLQHSFSTKFTGSIKAGARYTDYIHHDLIAGTESSAWSPFVQGSLRYNYLPGSYVEAGFTHDRSATDVGALDGENSLFYATISHSFTQKFVGSITGSAQNSDYQLVGNQDVSEWMYSIGLNLEYHFTSYLSANIAYNYDRVDSDNAILPGRSYDRNRVFMGITASY